MLRPPSIPPSLWTKLLSHTLSVHWPEDTRLREAWMSYFAERLGRQGFEFREAAKSVELDDKAALKFIQDKIKLKNFDILCELESIPQADPLLMWLDAAKQTSRAVLNGVLARVIVS
mmetsp:Transcript_26364/g.47322  ORF Transcript_26364/g.47322 Transcript_26364/m.47322 type:complete len:117 (+) Transcript_26364:1288-1638(+)